MSEGSPASTIAGLVDSEDTAYAFQAMGDTIGNAGFSGSMTKQEDIELLAYHIFEIQRKYDEPAQELLSESISEYNDQKGHWQKAMEGAHQ